MNGYEIKNATDKSATIYIYEQIGEDWMGDGLTAKAFAEDLKKLGNVKELNIRINSVGGSVFEARAMASQLRDHPARKIVDIDGVCASAATYLACAGNEVRIAEDGVYMIHPPQGFAMGAAVDMRKTAEILDTIETGMVTIYARRTGKEEKEIAKLIEAETWMDATAAKEMGFVDSVSEPRKMTAKLDLAKTPGNRMPFRKMPDSAKPRIEVANAGKTPGLDTARDAAARMGMRLAMREGAGP